LFIWLRQRPHGRGNNHQVVFEIVKGLVGKSVEGKEGDLSLEL
jgi:hypothetical protein